VIGQRHHQGRAQDVHRPAAARQQTHRTGEAERVGHHIGRAGACFLGDGDAEADQGGHRKRDAGVQAVTGQPDDALADEDDTSRQCGADETADDDAGYLIELLCHGAIGGASPAPRSTCTAPTR
jgi:hypothetical protein